MRCLVVLITIIANVLQTANLAKILISPPFGDTYHYTIEEKFLKSSAAIKLNYSIGMKDVTYVQLCECLKIFSGDKVTQGMLMRS